MSHLVSEALQNLILSIPDEELDLERLSMVIAQEIAKAEATARFHTLKVVMYTPKNAAPGDSPEEEVLFEKPNMDLSGAKEVVFQLGNGGCVHIFWTPASGIEFDEALESEYHAFAKLLYIVFGRTKAMEFMTRLTYTDALTGIANTKELGRFMGKRAAMGMLDFYCANFVNIKDMKIMNERYSIAIGDQILVQYAQKIKNFLGSDDCVARMGGDNFFVFIEKQRQFEFLRFIDELCLEIQMPGEFFDLVKIDSRVGYYAIRTGDSIDDAMSCSSIALSFTKKDNGPNVLMFEDSMKADMLRLNQLAESIPDALGNEEFEVYYQPKALMEGEDDYRLHGAEALVRWNKEGTLISPDEFIPLLEKHGMVDEIDFYVFEHVCRDIKCWENKGLTPVCISSNFSRQHLRDPKFADKVEAIIKMYDVNPRYLEIEITESYDVDDMEALIEFERRMHELGVDLSVDDFGSGFSSLKMLKNIVADTVKLDKSIVDGVGGDEKKDEIIVAHVIHMIKELGKNVIAEGVEKKSQADFLMKNGCKLIQGYLYGRPMPKYQFEERLSSMNIELQKEG